MDTKYLRGLKVRKSIKRGLRSHAKEVRTGKVLRSNRLAKLQVRAISLTKPTWKQRLLSDIIGVKCGN